jgi:hypothetical protein
MALVDGRGARGWLIAGRVCAAVGWVLWVVMQLLADDPFPPDISVSQYGIGPTGWVFTVWALALAAAPLLLLRAAPVPGPAAPLLWVGFGGAAVMAVVRTDDGGGAMSWHAQVHMIGAIVALVFVPLGILLALRDAPPAARRLAAVLSVAAAGCGALVVVSAAGVDTAGLGAPGSWALWQGTLVVIEMLLFSVYAVAAGRSRIRAERAGR